MRSGLTACIQVVLVCVVTATVSILSGQPAWADDCSGPEDCARVVEGTGWLAALLALIFGTAAAKSRRAGSKHLGKDGPVPQKYHKDVEKAIKNAQKLKGDKKFIDKFNRTLEQLTGKSVPADTYAKIVDNIQVHTADTSQDPRISKEFAAEQAARKADPTFEPGDAYSKVGDDATYIREERMGKGERAITNTIIHESAHLAGAPGDPIAEIAIQGIEQASGFTR